MGEIGLLAWFATLPPSSSFVKDDLVETLHPTQQLSIVAEEMVPWIHTVQKSSWKKRIQKI